MLVASEEVMTIAMEVVMKAMTTQKGVVHGDETDSYFRKAMSKIVNTKRTPRRRVWSRWRLQL